MIQKSRFLQKLNNQNGWQFTIASDHPDQVRFSLAFYHLRREIKRSFIKINVTRRPYQWVLSGTERT